MVARAGRTSTLFSKAWLSTVSKSRVTPKARGSRKVTLTIACVLYPASRKLLVRVVTPSAMRVKRGT